MGRVTLADVALRAGVSTATVSHVLREDAGGTIRVSAATREAVRAAAESLQYVPSTAGRGLASGATGRIAIVLPNLYQPYFARMAEAVILELESRGWTSTVRLSHDPGAELDALMGRSTADADAVIVCPRYFDPDHFASAPPPRPVVQIGGGPTRGIDRVEMGEFEGALAAARHLLEIGRRRIAYLAEPWLDQERSLRFRAYRTALEEAGESVDPRLVVVGADWDRRESGLEAMVGLIRSGAGIDGVMCVNDAVAVGALRAAALAGLRVPEDVAVTGFDNTEESEFTGPPLTSVDPGVPEMARLAVEMVADRLAGAVGPARTLSAPTALVTRASTGV